MGEFHEVEGYITFVIVPFDNWWRWKPTSIAAEIEQTWKQKKRLEEALEEVLRSQMRDLKMQEQEHKFRKTMADAFTNSRDTIAHPAKRSKSEQIPHKSPAPSAVPGKSL